MPVKQIILKQKLAPATGRFLGVMSLTPLICSILLFLWPWLLFRLGRISFSSESLCLMPLRGWWQSCVPVAWLISSISWIRIRSVWCVMARLLLLILRTLSWMISCSCLRVSRCLVMPWLLMGWLSSMRLCWRVRVTLFSRRMGRSCSRVLTLWVVRFMLRLLT